MAQARLSGGGMSFPASTRPVSVAGNELYSSQYGSAQTSELAMSAHDMSLHSMDLSPRRGSIEAAQEDKSLSRLAKKRKEKMRQSQGSC